MSNFCISLFSVFFWLYYGHAFAYDEPDNFAGLKFGKDLTKQLPECKGPIQAIGKRCYQKGRLAADSRPDRDLSRLGAYKLYNMGEIQKYVSDIIADQSDDGKLSKVTALFDTENAQRLLAILNTRYGKPTRQDYQVNNKGQSLNNTIAVWRGEIVSIVFESRISEIKRGMITWKVR